MTKKDYILIADCLTPEFSPYFYESVSDYHNQLINRLITSLKKDNPLFNNEVKFKDYLAKRKTNAKFIKENLHLTYKGHVIAK